jgi:hypothetical protein
MHGQLKNGDIGVYWVDRGVNGNSLGTTSSPNNAASFSITKWEFWKILYVGIQARTGFKGFAARFC